MELLELKCRNCGSKLSSPEVSAKLRLVRCSHCGAVYALRDDSSPESEEELSPKPQVELPSGLLIADDGRELTISRRRLNEATLGALLIVFLWGGISVYAWSQDSVHGVYWYVNWLAFVVLVYYVVVGFVNRWVIRASHHLLTVRDEPLPWASGVSVDTRRVRQFFVKERLEEREGVTIRRFDLYAIDATGKTGLILDDLTTIEQAFFLEQELERFLGITDELIDGEVGEMPREEV